MQMYVTVNQQSIKTASFLTPLLFFKDTISPKSILHNQDSVNLCPSLVTSTNNMEMVYKKLLLLCAKKKNARIKCLIAE